SLQNTDARLQPLRGTCVGRLRVRNALAQWHWRMTELRQGSRQEFPMKIAILAACITGIALAACRREEPAPFYEPMKLGSDVKTLPAK
ncbi:hypothetical protein ACIAM7_18500, partial [Acinetobacter baumannii]|uniref:hypothetical protein n=1 Tax=Acinetobacter baumannii TaxID=470 RepID=UPI00378DEC27